MNLSQSLSKMLLYLEGVPHAVQMEVIRAAEALEAKAKEPEKRCGYGCDGKISHIDCPAHGPRSPKPSGWRAREMRGGVFLDHATGEWTIGAVEIHPSAVRVREHRFWNINGWTNWNDCTGGIHNGIYEHRDLLQTSFEP